jgi:ABC-type Fe3+-hydroxamate transport system substrate-binding protein
VKHRIVSLVPSLTEWLVALGLEEELVGITPFCVHPSHLKGQKTKVGGTKNPNIERIRLLKPTVVVLNKEENREEDAALLSEFTTLLVTEISSVTQAWEEMKRIARFFEKSEVRANELQSLWEKIPKPGNGESVLYLIWKNPWMAAGSDTYISSVLKHLGYQNILKNENRYPQLTKEQLMELSPEYIFLSSEPYPFKKQHLEEVQHLFPNSKVVLVDGEKYSWYGERMSWVEELL